MNYNLKRMQYFLMLELSSRGKQRGGGGITFSKTSGPLVKLVKQGPGRNVTGWVHEYGEGCFFSEHRMDPHTALTPRLWSLDSVRSVMF